jgi:hypothetical protein
MGQMYEECSSKLAGTIGGEKDSAAGGAILLLEAFPIGKQSKGGE